MANELMIPEASAVPDFIRNPEAARQANEDAGAGISTGFPARIKFNGKQFDLVDGNGDAKPFPPAKLVSDEAGNVYMPMIVLRAKKDLSKAWYAKPWVKGEDAEAPDCFSNDAERPDSSVKTPQCDTCAACPQNAWGSAVDQNGMATKGKACRDKKVMAVFVPGFGVHSFETPPTSLKNFGLFVKQLSAAGIPLTAIKTLVGFDLTASFPVVMFNFGGYVTDGLTPEQHPAMLAKLKELAESSEVADIIGGITAPAALAVEAPVPTAVKAPAAPTAPAVETVPPPEDVPALEKAVADDLGLGLGVPASEAIIDVPAEPVADTSAAPADADLIAALDL